MAESSMEEDRSIFDRRRFPGRSGRRAIESDEDEALVATPRRPAMGRQAKIPPSHRQSSRQTRSHALGSSSNPEVVSDSDDPVLNDIDRHAERNNKRVKRDHQSPRQHTAQIEPHESVPRQPRVDQQNQYLPSPLLRHADQQINHRPDFQDPTEQNATAIVQHRDDDKVSETAVRPNRQPREVDVEEERQPWYYDVKFDLDMYQGPGYEKFPVALGTVEGHKEICDEFKSRRRAKAEGRRGTISNNALAFKERVLKQTLEMFPDISPDFVNRQTDLLVLQNPQLRPEELPLEAVLNNILEMDEYPKGPKKDKKSTENPPTDGTGCTIAVEAAARNGVDYFIDAVNLLARQFLHVPTCYIFKIVRDKAAIYDTYIHLDDTEKNYFQLQTSNRPYRRARQARQSIEKKYLRPPRCDRPRSVEYGHWVNEIQAAKQYIEREMLRTNEEEKEREREADNFELHRINGLLIECQICFDDEIPINRAVCCEALQEHLFCYSCVARLADTQVGQMKHEMKCMHGGGCTADLDAEGIGKAVSIKTVDRLAFNRQQADIKAAGIEGLDECPMCDFKAILDPVEEATVFNCMNPECGRASCRKCKEEAHLLMTCEESKNDRGLEARHTVEEARTKSVLRPCPGCKVKIMKESGCNKMQCTQCGCLMCYLCKEDISKDGYNHFEKPGSKCALYDNNTEALHDAEADAAELEAIKRAKAQNTGLDDRSLRIETRTPKKALLSANNPGWVQPNHPPFPALENPVEYQGWRNRAHQQQAQQAQQVHRVHQAYQAVRVQSAAPDQQFQHWQRMREQEIERRREHLDPYRIAPLPPPVPNFPAPVQNQRHAAANSGAGIFDRIHGWLRTVDRDV